MSVLCPADRGDSGERQTCAETELGWQRNEYRERDHRWEIDSGVTFFFFLNPQTICLEVLRKVILLSPVLYVL